MVAFINVDSTRFTILFPDLTRSLTEGEFSRLMSDIKEEGIQVPVVVDGSNNIIDGINRLTVASQLNMGLAEIPFKVEVGLNKEQKYNLAVSLNAFRRHLNVQDLRELRQGRLKNVAKLRREGYSIRRIAEETGISHQQVTRDLKIAGEGSTVTPVTPGGNQGKVIGKDGRAYPAESTVPKTKKKKTGVSDEGSKTDRHNNDVQGALNRVEYLVKELIGTCHKEDRQALERILEELNGVSNILQTGPKGEK